MTKHVGRQAVVGRFFHGLPVVDATEPLRIVVNKTDLRKAKPLDPNNCVFAQACRRLFESHAVLILRRTAYVELPDSKGKRKVNRFIISDDVRDRIVRFDKTGKANEGGFIFNAPAESQRMDAKQSYGSKYRKAISSGKHRISHTKPNKKHARAMLGVRDGRGKLGINYAFNG